ncbi:MAG: zf-HC2 domain-containing protein [Pyrinomonadaceae bacterium]|nr:zf-HC2 domain-containing protein [Pyrinomonadaceae bacterium]
MLGHLTENQIEDYGRRSLSATELLSVADHLGVCESCRRQVERALSGDAAFLALRFEVFDPPAGIASSARVWTHPTVEQIAEYVDGMPTGEELQVVQDHLTICEQCALAVTDLRAFKSQVAPRLNREYHPAPVRATFQSWRHRLLAFLPSPLLRSPLAFSSALAVLLLMVIGWLIWQAQQKKEREVVIATPPTSFTPPSTPSVMPTPSPIPAPEAAPVIAELNDGEGRVVLDRAGKLSGVDNLPPAYQRMVRESLTNQRLTQSSLLVGLNRPTSSLMGGDEQGNKFSVTEPVGKVMLSDRPTFRWSQLEGATGYIIEVYDKKFNLVTGSSPLTDKSWTAPQPLKRGEIYSWQVKAIKDGQEFRSPRPPATQAKFRILDQRKANELTQAQGAYGSSHLTLGLLYAEAGLLDQAEKEFQALQKANPDSELVRRLLSQLQKLGR